MVFGFLKTAYAHVVTGVGNLITSGLEQVTGKKYARTTPEEFLGAPAGQVLSTAAAVVSIPLIAVGAVKAAPFIAKAVIAKPVTALVVGGIAVTSPKLIVEAGKGLVKGGMAVGEGYEKALEKGEEYGISEALVTGGLAAAGIVAAVAIPKVIKKGKEIFADVPSLDIQEIKPEKQLVTEKPVGIEGEVPITPEVTTIDVGKKPYKPRRAKIIPQVKQLVRINIITRSTSTGIRQNAQYI